MSADRRDTPSGKDPHWVREKVVAVRDFIEGTELVLDEAGYRDAAKDLYALRLRVSDLLSRLSR